MAAAPAGNGEARVIESVHEKMGFIAGSASGVKNRGGGVKSIGEEEQDADHSD